MSHQALAYQELSRLLVALEDELLKVSDAEVITTLSASRSGVDDITRLISMQLLKHQGDRPAPSRHVSPKVRPRRSARAKLEADVALLQRLLMARPELSPQLHAVLSAGRAARARDVERLIAELIRNGVLPEDD